MTWEQRYSDFDIAERFEELLDDPEYAFDLDREKVAEWIRWLSKDPFDRRQVKRRLRQYAFGDEEWMSGLG